MRIRWRTSPELRRPTVSIWGCVLILGSSACGGQDPMTGPTLGDAEHRILFVGNSLTYSNDLPGALASVAGAMGHDAAVASIALPNYALEDHWHRGVGELIRTLAPDVLVMQQGPSSLPENQEHLAAWSDSLSTIVREVDGQPALLMVWPDLSRAHAFDDVRDAYRGAADRVGGTFIPVGEAFRALHAQHPADSPFGPDGFHPSDTGTVLAAYVVAGTLFGDSVRGLSAQLPVRNGGRIVTLDESLATSIQAIADSVVADWR